MGGGDGVVGFGDGFGDGFPGLGDGFLGPDPHLERPQSTGRLTTGAHISPDFCVGLLARQLLVSSNTTSDLVDVGTHSSASPLKKL